MGRDMEERPSLEYQHKMQVWTVRQHLAGVQIQAITGFASVAINSIVLANGAAAAAILALLGTLWGKPESAQVAPSAIYAMSIFGVGTFAAILCACASYATQFCYANADFNDVGSRRRWWWMFFAIPLHAVAVLAGVAGMASFAFGAWFGIEALDAARTAMAQPAPVP